MVKTRTIVLEKVHVFAGNTTTTDTNPTRLTNSEITIPPLSLMEVVHIKVWWGPAAVPADGELFELDLLQYEPNSLPDGVSIDFRSLWKAMQRWRRLSSPGGATDLTNDSLPVTQMMERDEQMLFVSPLANMDLDTRRVTQVVGILSYSSGGATDVQIAGNISYRLTLVDRIWGDDSYTFGNGGAEEEWIDEDVWF